MSIVRAGRPSWWIVIGIAAMDVGATVFALPWFEAATVGVPFGAPWPPAFLVVGAVVGLTAVADVGIWRAAARSARGPPR